MSSRAQMKARSARSRPRASSPKAESASLASDNALETAFADAAGDKSANRKSRAISRPTL